jgi:transcriptional regulator with XRE-family HTH domain
LIAETNNEHTIAGRIKRLRAENDVQQQELAAALNISPSALRNLEHGDAQPRLSTLELLSDFFKVSIDWLVRGIAPTQDSGDGLDTLTLYRKTGFNDTALAFLGEKMERGQECGGQTEYVTTLNALISGGLLPLVWGLNALNKELADIDGQIKKVLGEHPKPKDIVEEMTLSNALAPLQERRDLLKLRYLRAVERVFDNLITKGDGE